MSTLNMGSQGKDPAGKNSTHLNSAISHKDEFNLPEQSHLIPLQEVHVLTSTQSICRLLRERKAEDHLFGDKDKFVTAAYKKKLEEDKKWLEEEAFRDKVEADEDVRKRGHMGDFYRCTVHSPSSLMLRIAVCPHGNTFPGRVGK